MGWSGTPQSKTFGCACSKRKCPGIVKLIAINNGAYERESRVQNKENVASSTTVYILSLCFLTCPKYSQVASHTTFSLECLEFCCQLLNTRLHVSTRPKNELVALFLLFHKPNNPKLPARGDRKKEKEEKKNLCLL